MNITVIIHKGQLDQLEALRGAAVIGVDIETAGENGLIPQRSQIRTIQLAVPGSVFVVDCFRTDPWSVLEPILTDEASLKVLHNAKFDLKHIYYHHKIEVQPIFCTFLAAQLLAKGTRGHRFGLDKVVFHFLGRKMDKEMQQSDWSVDTLSDSQIEYAAMDVEVLPDLHAEMQRLIERERLKRVSQLEFRTVMPVVAMELKGMAVDLKRWDQVQVRYEKQAAALETEILDTLRAPDDLPGMNTLNLNAPEQVLEALKALGAPLSGTAESQLRPHIAKFPVIEKLLQYRHLQKVLSSSVKTIRDSVYPETGRVHPNYHQIASSSGRFACSEPNIQQVPREKEVRACFVPASGYRYVIADYSQVELRVAAGMSGDRIMSQAYADGKDLHRLTAALSMNKDEKDVTSRERQAAKAINFGLIYAMGSKGLQQSARMSYGVDMTDEQASFFHMRFFETYPGIKSWHNRLKNEANSLGYVRTRAGRIRSYKNEELRVTELFNIPVQGTAAEGLKSAMCIFWNQAKKNGLDAQMVAIIHDEIIVEARADQIEQAKELLEKSMIQGIAWLVPEIPFEAEAVIAESWAEK